MLKEIKYYLMIACGAIAASCSDINEMQQEWLDRGETIYAGKIDSLSARGGMKRIQIVGNTRYARSAEKCIVRWNDQSKEFLLSDITQGESVNILLEGLEEGNYQFFINTLDKSGNRSIVEECFGYSYGESYISMQNPKRIVSTSADFSGATLVWNTVDNAVKVRIDYRTKDLNPVSRELPGDVESTLIEDWEWGGEIKITTFVLPEENALDLIELTPVTAGFVDYPEGKVPTDKFKVVALPTDIKGNGWGTKIEGLWDGIVGKIAANGYHNESAMMPHHFTIDMGINADITSLETWGRDDNNIRNPRHFQVWGRATLDGAETTLPSKDAGWENEAREKGWILICDGLNKDNYYNRHTVDPEIAKNIRYIRYRAIESWTASEQYSCLQELVFFTNKAL